MQELVTKGQQNSAEIINIKDVKVEKFPEDVGSGHSYPLSDQSEEIRNQAFKNGPVAKLWFFHSIP